VAWMARQAYPAAGWLAGIHTRTHGPGHDRLCACELAGAAREGLRQRQVRQRRGRRGGLELCVCVCVCVCVCARVCVCVCVWRGRVGKKGGTTPGRIRARNMRLLTCVRVCMCGR
jgi:hypothetical protein